MPTASRDEGQKIHSGINATLIRDDSAVTSTIHPHKITLTNSKYRRPQTVHFGLAQREAVQKHYSPWGMSLRIPFECFCHHTPREQHGSRRTADE